MKSSRTGTFLALLLASLAALHAAENRSEDNDNRLTQLRADPKSKRGIAFEDPYTDIYRAAVERRMREAATRRRQTKKDVQEDISTACAAWMLAARSGENRYRDFALELYDRFLKEQVEHDFHVSRPFGLVTLQMHTAGVLTGERRDLARGQALERITWFLDRRKNEDRYFDCNIALADTLAVACLARAFADDPALRAGEIRRAVAALGRRILETGDLNENASNYASLGICFFLKSTRASIRTAICGPCSTSGLTSATARCTAKCHARRPGNSAPTPGAASSSPTTTARATRSNAASSSRARGCW